MVATSPRAGTLRYSDRPLASRDETRMGRAAFLAPATRTSPRSRPPPFMTSLSIAMGTRGGPPHARGGGGGQAEAAASAPAAALLLLCSAHRPPATAGLRH